MDSCFVCGMGYIGIIIHYIKWVHFRSSKLITIIIIAVLCCCLNHHTLHQQIIANAHTANTDNGADNTKRNTCTMIHIPSHTHTPVLPCPRLVYREEAFYCEIMYIISISSILEILPFVMEAVQLIR